MALRSAGGVVLCVSVVVAVLNPEEYVNSLGGTGSDVSFSRGSVLPAVVRPWGMNAWAPQTVDDESFWFTPRDLWQPKDSTSTTNDFLGVRCTHQPSPWMQDYGQFLITPSVGSTPNAKASSLRFDVAASSWRPYLWNASLQGLCSPAKKEPTAQAAIELTSTSRAAALRLRFGNCGAAFHRVTVALSDAVHDEVVLAKNRGGLPALSGISRQSSGGTPASFGHYFYLTVEGADGQALPHAAVNVRTDGVAAATIAVPTSGPGGDVAHELIVRVGTSFVSHAQAELNHQREIAGKPFDELVAESKAEWRQILGRVNVTEVGNWPKAKGNGLLEVLYSSLYRASQFPRPLHEVDAEGRDIHWSPYDPAGRVLPGKATTDSGFWDAYRTVYPMLSVLYPDRLGSMVEGWVTAFNEGGWLPNWASPGYRNVMPGTMGDVVLADAIVKNIPGFNRTAAYLAIIKDSTVEPPRAEDSAPQFGRPALADYKRLGYVPRGAAKESVSLTLNYLAADHAVAQAAKAMGKADDAQKLQGRANRYSELFDPLSGFFRAKDPHGSFVHGFDEFEWQGDYTEGGPWQYRFSVPFDPKGLQKLYSSAGLDLCERLERMNTAQNTVDVGPGHNIIHEETEMKKECWGQYAHNNQPQHDALYMMVAAAGRPGEVCSQRGQYWLRKVMTQLYQPGPEMYPGDEDNGEMGAWYVLSALGLYQLEPAGATYVLGSPLFENVTVGLPGGRSLRVIAEDNGQGRPYVASVTWNGDALNVLELPYAMLMQGGTLRFRMTDRPTGLAGGEVTGEGRKQSPRVRAGSFLAQTVATD